MVERFTLKDGDTMYHEVTIADPQDFTQRWTIACDAVGAWPQAAGSVRFGASFLRCRLVLTQRNPTATMAIVVTMNIISDLPPAAQTLRPGQSSASVMPRRLGRIAGWTERVFS